MWQHEQGIPGLDIYSVYQVICELLRNKDNTPRKLRYRKRKGDGDSLVHNNHLAPSHNFF